MCAYHIQKIAGGRMGTKTAPTPETCENIGVIDLCGIPSSPVVGTIHLQPSVQPNGSSFDFPRQGHSLSITLPAIFPAF